MLAAPVVSVVVPVSPLDPPAPRGRNLPPAPCRCFNPVERCIHQKLCGVSRAALAHSLAVLGSLSPVVDVGLPPFTIGAVPSTYKVRTAPLSDDHDVSEQRVEELRAALEAVGARSIEVSHEVTFELDAQRGSDAMADVAEVLFALSWPPAVTASIVR
jgi:hypothetical protein